ncbi:MAG: replication protein RepA [Candidatus Aenigmarchaeota archaeon]|nr:replication protein RepA [Candidatus Aenigmarchaeota archaeon]
MADEDVRKRLPSVRKRIAEITADDMRVQVIGTVIDAQDNRIILDDGTGQVTAVFDGPQDLAGRKRVRVFGRVIAMEGGVELQAEILQDATGLDLQLLKRVEQAEQARKK